jgi:hypothetical protein
MGVVVYVVTRMVQRYGCFILIGLKLGGALESNITVVKSLGS